MINLLPNSVREEHEYGRKNRKLTALIFLVAGTALAVAAIMIVSVGFLSDEETSIQKSIDENKAIITTLEAETSDLSDVASRLRTTYTLFDGSIKFSELIPEIGSLLPSGSVIDGLSLTGGNTDPLQLNVSLISAELAPVMQKNLIDSELFEAADIITITPVGSDASAYNYSASVSVSFTGSAEAKKKAAAAAAAAAQALKEANTEDEE
jgi:hypothetical protein